METLRKLGTGLAVCGAIVFIGVLFVSAYWENDIRWLHFFQSWIYLIAIALMLKREQPLISVTVRSVRRLSRLLLIFVSSLSSVAWSQGTQKLQPSNGFQIFSRDLDRDRNLLRIPGMAAAIVEDGRIVWRRDFGLAEVENKLPVTASTEFPIASLSKTMSAAILMQLREAGLLRLDDAVVKYLPDSGLAANITIREVMSHTSDGVPNEEFLYSGARYAVLSRVIRSERTLA
jgi:CubicO group peptidase (beta-lactamase class C family)